MSIGDIVSVIIGAVVVVIVAWVSRGSRRGGVR
jgi:hypothetical protein